MTAVSGGNNNSEQLSKFLIKIKNKATNSWKVEKNNKMKLIVLMDMVDASNSTEMFTNKNQ